jgi:hypothetical protein
VQGGELEVCVGFVADKPTQLLPRLVPKIARNDLAAKPFTLTAAAEGYNDAADSNEKNPI